MSRIHPADMALIRAKLFPNGDPLRIFESGPAPPPAAGEEPLRLCLHAPADASDPGRAFREGAPAHRFFSAGQTASLIEELAPGLLAQLRGDPAGLLDPLRHQLLTDVRRLRPRARELVNLLFAEAQGQSAQEQARALADQERETFLRLRQRRLLYVGCGAAPASFCVLGARRRDGALVALSMDGGQVILLGGVPGFGKSQCALCLIEAHLAVLPSITSAAHQPTAAVAFVTDDSAATLPELLAALAPNQQGADIERLWEEYRAAPRAIARVNVVVPPWQLADWSDKLRPALQRHPGLRLLPLRVGLGELGISGLECVLNADPDAAYFQRLVEEATDLGGAIDIDRWKGAIAGAVDLNAPQRAAAGRALRLVERVAARGQESVWDLVEPGVLTLFVLGGPRIGHKDVMPLCAGLLEALSQPAPRHGAFQRVFLLDEVNRLDGEPRLWGKLVTLARRIRHRGGVLILLGQDFLKAPEEMMALASLGGTFRVESPKVVAHLREHFGGFRGFRTAQARELLRGELALAVRESTDKGWEGGGVHVVALRPPLAEHGGHGRSAL